MSMLEAREIARIPTLPGTEITSEPVETTGLRLTTTPETPADAVASDVLDIVVARSEGALLRVIGLVVRRGYEIVALRAEPDPNGSDHRVTLELRPVDDRRIRDPLVLRRQLEKLYDVRGVVVRTGPNDGGATPR